MLSALEALYVRLCATNLYTYSFSRPKSNQYNSFHLWYTGRLNYNHIIALAHFKLLKSLSASSNRVLKTLCAAHIVSADFINLCSEYGVTLCH